MFKGLVHTAHSPSATVAGRALGVVALVCAVVLGVVAAVWLAGRSSWPAWTNLVGYLGALAGVLFIGQGLVDLVQWFGQRERDIHADRIYSQLKSGQSGEPFVLYLRPFISTNQIAEQRVQLTAIRVADQIQFAPTQERVEFEEEIEQALRPLGRLVALGQPLEHFGAGRIRVPDDVWQDAICTLIDNAALIVMLPSPRPGTSWEVNHVIDSGALARTILVDPPNEKGGLDKAYDPVAEWTGTREIFASHGYELPTDDPEGMLIWFGDAKQPQREVHLGLGAENNLTAFARDVVRANERTSHA